MADTTYIKSSVEPYVREVLAKEFNSPFEAKQLTLETGGTHEFNAVSEDQRVVAVIKTSSGRTSGGGLPSGKMKVAESDLYYLTLVRAPNRFLVLTDPEFYELLSSRLHGRLARGLSLKLIELPDHIRAQLRTVQKEASAEVSPNRRR
jgi:hypothetical protein